MMKKTIGLVVFFILISLASFADGYWLELKGPGLPGDTLFIRIRYGGVDEQKNRYLKNGTELDKMKDFIVFVVSPHGKNDTIVIRQYNDYWEGSYIPQGKGLYRILALDESLPVVERPDSMQNIKPIQYLCTIYSVKDNTIETRPVQYLDLLVAIKNDTAMIKAFIAGKPVAAGTKLRIFYPDNHDETVFVNINALAVLPLVKKGRYLVRLDMVKNKSGNFKGKRYFSIRHRCDYTLDVD